MTPNPAVVALLLAAVAGPVAAQVDATSQRDSSRRDLIGVDVGYTQFDHDLDPWRTAAISFSHRTAAGSVIGRVNLAERFGTTGTQVEMDAYPRVGTGRYFYLNAGLSGSSIFPGQRVGAEYYTNLPDAWEASGGVRVLWFDRVPVTLFTGTIGKYTGNYWISVRPFLHQTTTGTSASTSLTVRRYGEDADHYIGFRVGLGSAPSDAITPDAIGRTTSSSVAVNGSHVLAGRTTWTWTVSRDAEGLGPGVSRQSWTVSTGFALRLE